MSELPLKPRGCVQESDPKSNQPTRRFRVLLLLIGLMAGQFILLGPSLIGSKILLPLDILGMPGVYLSPSQLPVGYSGPDDVIPSDLVYVDKPSLDFAAGEVRAGRLPMWVPGIYAGAPFASTGKYSLFFWMYCLFPDPITLAWMQVIKSLVVGLGAYLFFRRVLKVKFWPAVIGAWCYPLTSYFILWQGFRLVYVVCWLPWMWLAVDRCVRRPGRWSGPQLALVTALCVLGGQADVAGLVLIGSGLFAIGCLIDQFGKHLLDSYGRRAVLRLFFGWALGLLLTMPYLLPLVEYSHTGDRFVRRSAGAEERPPVGLTALPQIVLPYIYGATHRNAILIEPRIGNLQESASTGYIGLVATLLLAPLAFASRKHLAFNITAVLLAFLSFCWLLNVAGVVQIMRLPGLNFLSFNRFAFVGAFAILSMAVIGLEQLGSGLAARSKWFALPAALVLGLCCWCLWCWLNPFEPSMTRLSAQIEPMALLWGLSVPQAIAQVRHFFHSFYGVGAALCGIALGAWILVLGKFTFRPWMVGGIASVALIDLLVHGYGMFPQCDPSLYYPRIPALVELASTRPPGRILGVSCLPSNLNLTHGLSDIRGYDGVDPKRLMDLLDLVREPGNGCPDYARSQWYEPRLQATASGHIVVPPVLNMLNVRYLVFRQPLAPHIQHIIQKEDYTIVENEAAMPRVFVPRTVQVVSDDRQRLQRLGGDDFNPREVAYVEQPVDLPSECSGRVEIVEEIPSRVTMKLDMQRPGLVVLADLWDAGWHAYLDDKPAPVLRTNHAVRGVVVPAGQARLVFQYEPASFRVGLILAGIACVICLMWGFFIPFANLATSVQTLLPECKGRLTR